MKIEIKSIGGSILFEGDFCSLSEALTTAVKKRTNLAGADLTRAYLADANLAGANLAGGNLTGAYLTDANLADANLAGANLAGANLAGADLTRAYLADANLTGAYLTGAYLTDANLADANLAGAYLAGANLADAYLAHANLTRAYLADANLAGANLAGAKIPDRLLASIYARRTITPDGDLVGWKKLANGTICKLLIPADAKRVGGLVGRKCRAEFAKVLEGDGESQFKDVEVVYTPGAIVRPDKYDPDPCIECSNGIHFFITREEAEAF